MSFLNLLSAAIEVSFIGLFCVLPLIRAWSRTARTIAPIATPIPVSVPTVTSDPVSEGEEELAYWQKRREAIAVPMPPVLAIVPPAHLRVAAPSRLQELRAKYGRVLPPVAQVAPSITPEDVDEALQVIPAAVVGEVAMFLASLPEKQKPHPLVAMAS